jgi:hypothetical protein
MNNSWTNEQEEMQSSVPQKTQPKKQPLKKKESSAFDNATTIGGFENDDSWLQKREEVERAYFAFYKIGQPTSDLDGYLHAAGVGFMQQFLMELPFGKKQFHVARFAGSYTPIFSYHSKLAYALNLRGEDGRKLVKRVNCNFKYNDDGEPLTCIATIDTHDVEGFVGYEITKTLAKRMEQNSTEKSMWRREPETMWEKTTLSRALDRLQGMQEIYDETAETSFDVQNSTKKRPFD